MKKIPIRNTLSDGFNIRDLAVEKDIVEPLHRHSFFYILALKKGTGDHTIDFTPYTISDQVIFFIRPGQVHQLTLKAGSRGYLVQFNAPALLRTNNFYQPDPARFKKLFSLLTYIFEEHTEKQTRYREVIKANLEIFLIELTRQQRSPVNNAYLQERFEELSQLLTLYISNYKQVAQYADLLHLSPFQLNAITKTMTGKTCSALINEYIILESRRLLLATSEQVNQIASHLGYEDVSYFIRFFKKHTGYTPEVFRQKFR